MNWLARGLAEVRIWLAHDSDLRNTTRIARMRGQEEDMSEEVRNVSEEVHKVRKVRKFRPISLACFTTEEIAQIDSVAQSSGTSRAQYIRRAVSAWMWLYPSQLETFK